MKAVQLNRDHIPTGTFRLQARFDDQPAAALALASLWLLCTYGGIGARTRRGFGSLCVVGVDGPLPDGWTETRLRQPGIDFYRRLTALQPPPGIASPDPTSHDQQDRDCLLHGLATNGWDTATPTYPVLGTEHTKAGLGVRTYPTWHALLTDTGRQLREYRADDVLDNGRSRTREWTEVIQHKTDDHFGLGGLGLPVVFDKKTEVHADNAAGEKLRRASPLWLHPVHDGTEWRLLSFALINEFLPADVSVHLWLDGKQDRQLHVTAADADELATAWIEYQTRPPHAGR
jgi:CRISPR-associated protein Cmr1